MTAVANPGTKMSAGEIVAEIDAIGIREDIEIRGETEIRETGTQEESQMEILAATESRAERQTATNDRLRRETRTPKDEAIESLVVPSAEMKAQNVKPLESFAYM